ncbi:hypothetical protein ACJX0J_024847, partial [Zea mays]
GVDREALVDMGQIKYSEKYFNDTYEYSPPARGRQAPPQEPPPIRERVARDRSAAEPRVGALRDPPPGDAHHAVPPPDQLPAAVGGGFRADAGQENRLKQVQEMQSNCDKGLKHMSCEAPLLGPMAELWPILLPLVFVNCDPFLEGSIIFSFALLRLQIWFYLSLPVIEIFSKYLKTFVMILKVMNKHVIYLLLPIEIENRKLKEKRKQKEMTLLTTRVAENMRLGNSTIYGFFDLKMVHNKIHNKIYKFV